MTTQTTTASNERIIGNVTLTYRKNKIHYKIPDDMSAAQFKRWKKTNKNKISTAIDELYANN